MEMDDSLQMQLYDQMRQMLYDQMRQMQYAQAQMVSDYRMFQQQMQLMRMEQSQAFTGIVGPSIDTVRSVPDRFHGFMDNQLEGLYGGFGLSPELRQGFQQYVWDPARNRAQGALSMGNAFMYSSLSNYPASLSFEQRAGLAQAMAGGLASTGAGALGFGATAAGIVGGLYGGAKLVGAAGLGTTLGIGAVGLGAYHGGKWLMTNDTVHALTGVGGWNPDIFSPVNFAKKQIAFDQGIRSLLTSSSYRILASDVERSPYTMGLSPTEVQDWAKEMRGWGSRFSLEQEDIQAILKTAIDSNLITGVRDLEDFESKFAEQVDYIKNASKILNKSYQEVAEMISEFKRVGIQPTNFDQAAAELKAYSGLIGTSVDNLSNFVLGSVQAFGHGTPVGAEQIKDHALFTSAVMKSAYDEAKAGGDTATMDLINNFGGPTGSAAAVRKAQQDIFSRSSSYILLAGLYDHIDGEFVLNKQKLRELEQGVTEGTVDARTLQSTGLSKYRSWDINTQLAFRNASQSGYLLMNQDDTDVSQQLEVILKGMQKSFPTLDTEGIMTTIFNLDPTSARLLQINMDATDKFGANIKLSEQFQSMYILSFAERQTLAEDMRKSNFFKSSDVARKLFGADLLTNAQYDVENWIQNNMNARAGLPPIDFVGRKLSETDYVFDRQGLKELRQSESKEVGELARDLKKLIDNFGDTVNLSKFHDSSVLGRYYTRKLEIDPETATLADVETVAADAYKGYSRQLREAKIADERGRATEEQKRLLRGEDDFNATMADVVEASIRSRMARADRGALAVEGANLFASVMTGFLKYAAEGGTLQKFGYSEKDAENLFKEYSKYHKDIGKMVQSGDYKDEAALAEALDKRFEKLVGKFGDIAPGGEQVVLGYVRADLSSRLEDMLLNTPGLTAEQSDELGTLLQQVREMDTLDGSVPEIFNQWALLSKKYGMGEETETALDIDKARTVTETNTELLETYFDALEKQNRDLDRRLSRVESNSYSRMPRVGTY